MQPLGKRLKKDRQDADLSHERLGAKAGVSRQTIINIEKGTQTPKADVLRALALALGSSVDYWLDIGTNGQTVRPATPGGGSEPWSDAFGEDPQEGGESAAG